MVEYVEKTLIGLRVQIDRTLCVGFGDCVTEAPQLFVLDEEGIAVFIDGGDIERDVLIRACEVCPVDALVDWDEKRPQVVP